MKKKYLDLHTVCDYYSQFTADELETMTHSELPWINVRDGIKSYES